MFDPFGFEPPELAVSVPAADQGGMSARSKARSAAP
jgi:hypothetical protein